MFSSMFTFLLFFLPLVRIYDALWHVCSLSLFGVIRLSRQINVYGFFLLRVEIKHEIQLSEYQICKVPYYVFTFLETNWVISIFEEKNWMIYISINPWNKQWFILLFHTRMSSSFECCSLIIWETSESSNVYQANFIVKYDFLLWAIWISHLLYENTEYFISNCRFI